MSAQRADFRADLYSLGATLFHLLSGRPPFSADTPLELIVRHAVEPPPRFGDEFPSAVRTLVARLLEKDPARRPASYTDVIEAIGSALDTGGAVEPAPLRSAPSDSGTDALSASQLAAARAALELGRDTRAREILEQLVGDRSRAAQTGVFGAERHLANRLRR